MHVCGPYVARLSDPCYRPMLEILIVNKSLGHRPEITEAAYKGKVDENQSCEMEGRVATTEGGKQTAKVETNRNVSVPNRPPPNKEPKMTKTKLT